MEIKMDLLLVSEYKDWENILKDKISEEIKDVESGHKYFNEYVIRYYTYDKYYNKLSNEIRFYIDDNYKDYGKTILEVHTYRYIYHLTIQQIIQELYSMQHKFEIYIQKKMSVLRNIFKKLRIRETIKYYIVNWYSNTWFFNNVIYKMYLLENHLSKCRTKE